MITISRDAGVLQLRLNRPARLNALTLAMSRQLLAAVRAASADDAVRVLLLSGAGNSFCAGKDRDDPAGAEFAGVLQDLAAALLASAKPVVACVHGWVVGAGLELMLNADLCVAARSSRFMLPEVRLGLFGTGGVTALLVAAVGLQRAKALMLLGNEFGAADAERWGLVGELADDDHAAATAQARARQLAGIDAAALTHSKALLQQAAVGDFAAVLAREAAVHALRAGR